MERFFGLIIGNLIGATLGFFILYHVFGIRVNVDTRQDNIPQMQKGQLL